MKLITDKEHVTLEALRAFLSEDLTSYNRNRIERHLLQCPICFEKLDTLKSELETETKKAA